MDNRRAAWINRAQQHANRTNRNTTRHGRASMSTLADVLRPSGALQAVKATTMLRLLVLAVYAPLASPYLLTVLPMLAERMLADAPNWWGTEFHYNAYLVVPLLCAGVDGIARIQRCAASRPTDRRLSRWVGGWARCGQRLC